MREDAPQGVHPLREPPKGLRYSLQADGAWRMMPNALPPWHAIHRQAQRWIARGCFEVDERKAVAELARRVQEETGESVELACVPGLHGPDAAQAAEGSGIRLEVVRVPEAKRGFVLLPRRWVVERSFAWSSRFKRLAKDYERLPETLAGLHVLAFCALVLGAPAPWLQGA